MKILRFCLPFMLVATLLLACSQQPAPGATEEEPAAPPAAEATEVIPTVEPRLVAPTASPAPEGEGEEDEGETSDEAETTMSCDTPGGTLVIIEGASPQSLVSIIDPGKEGIGMLHNTMDGLLNFDETYTTVYPAIAEDFPEQPDELTYIFHLREGVHFHDGKEVTSEDVKYTYERLLDESYGATFGQVYRDNIESIETPDDYTIIFHLKQPWPIFLSFVAGNHTKIENKELAELPEYGKTVWSGTGPFMITEWAEGQYVKMERNPNYWNAGEENLPYLDEVIFRQITEPSAKYAALETGEGHVVIEPEFKDIDRFEQDPDYHVEVLTSSDSTVIALNTTRPPFDDQRVRLAISKGIDRQEIVDVLFFGYARPGGDLFPPFHWAHDPEITMPYDPEGAKALLEEAGYNESNPLRFILMPRTEVLFADQAILIQAQLAKIGVEVEVLPVEYTTLGGMTAGAGSTWEGDAALYRITPLRGTAFEYTYYQHGALGALNRSSINEPDGDQAPELEEALLKANSYSDYDAAQREEGYPYYQEVSRIWLDVAPGILLNWWENADVMRPEVKNWIPAVGDIMTLKQVCLTSE